MSTLPFRRQREAAESFVERAPVERPDGPGSARTMAEGRRSPARVEIPGVVAASHLEIRPAPAMVPTGIAAVDALTGGLPRGALTEACGPASSGRTSLLFSVLAQATARGEVCALVDAADSFAPAAAQAAGVELTRLLWVRCEAVASGQWPVASRRPATRNAKRETRSFIPLEQALKATDLLLQSGGFGVVAIDLGDIPPPAARRVPLTSWFRFRRAVENTATVLLVLVRESCAKTCVSLVLQFSGDKMTGAGLRAPGSRPSHAELLTGILVRSEVIRSRVSPRESAGLMSDGDMGRRKPARAAGAQFETRAEWA